MIEYSRIKFGICLFVILLVLPLVMAPSLTKTKIDDTSIKINDGTDIALFKLDYNTNQCLINCEASGTVTFYKPASLFDSVRFTTGLKDRNIQYNIQIQDTKQVITNLPDYKTTCGGKNETEDCKTDKTGEHQITQVEVIWKDYKGEILNTGTYKWRITATKKPLEAVDWIANSNGIELTEWTWWDADWTRKRQLNISENSNIQQKNYTITIDIPFAAGMLNGFGDIRFLNASETGELNYWLENKTDGVTAKFNVLIPSLTKQANTTIYLYYGNAIATTSSDFNKAFAYANKFDANSNGWKVTSGAISISNGHLQGNNPGGNNDIYYNLTYLNISIAETKNWKIRISALQNESANYFLDWNFMQADLVYGSANHRRIALNSGTNDKIRGVTGEGYATIVILGDALAVNNWYEYVGTIMNNSDATTGDYNLTRKKLSDGTTVTATGRVTGTYPQAAYMLLRFYDGEIIANMSISPFTSPEPTFTFGGIESAAASAYSLNAEVYNASLYETENSYFSQNITVNPWNYNSSTAIFYYNGTAYTPSSSTSGNETVYSKTLFAPEVTQINHKNVYWFITLTNDTGNFNVTTTTVKQTITPLNFSLCGASPMNIIYLNLTFKDETSGVDLNGTIDSSWNYYLGSGGVYKSKIITNTTELRSHSFCFQPQARQMNENVSISYSSTGYPIRHWIYSSPLTNVTLNKTLYLLGSSDGTYSTYIVQTSSSQNIAGVSVTVEKQFGGIWTVIEGGTTDDSGAITFWLNPNYDHRFTFSKTGYSTVIKTLKPTASTYTVIMGEATSNASYNSNLEGITWIYGPSGICSQLAAGVGKTYSFWFTINASKANIVSCRMELVNSTYGSSWDGVINASISNITTGCTSTGGILNVSYTVQTGMRFWGKLYIDTGGGLTLVDSNAYWFCIENEAEERGTLLAWFKYMRELDQFGDDDGRQEFSRIILFFLIIFICFGVISYATGYDFITAGGNLMLLVPIVIAASVAGFLQMNMTLGLNPWVDKYGIALIVALIGIGYAFNSLAERRG